MIVHEKYKTFDVEWIANPPANWTTKRLKYFIDKVAGGGTPSTGDAEYWSGDIPWVSSKDMKTDLISDTEEHISERAVEESSTSRVIPGTVLMVARSGILRHTLPVAISAAHLTINQDIKAFTVGEKLLARFLFWKLKGLQSDILDICGKVGATVESIDVEALLSLPFSIPRLQEQTAIANYLDKETARIDELVKKKKRLIELLKEERLAIINHAVTRGLDPTTKLKPSNIEWLGDIPEHWGIKRLKWFFQLSRGVDLTTEDFVYGEVPVYGSNGCIGFHNQALASGPGITVGRSGSVGEVNFVDRDYWPHNTALYVYRNFGNDWKYLYHFLTVLDLKMLSSGSVVGTLNRNHIHDSHVTIPLIDEQERIVMHIETKTQNIDATIAKVEKEIGLLNEYRTALISEVVTGKVKVV